MPSKFVCIVMSAAIIMGQAVGAELHVPAQYADVQDAISAASDGDVIVLAQGTYTSRFAFAFYGKRITVRSSDPLDDAVRDSTVITNRVWFTYGEGQESVLAGLTLGGGIYCSSSSPTIERNRILFAGQPPDLFPQAHYFGNSKAMMKDNVFASTVLPYARLIYCSESAVRIVGNTFTSNEAGNIIDVWGAVAGATTIIQGNSIIGNKASSAIYITDNTPMGTRVSAIVTGNVISANDTEENNSKPAIAIYHAHDAVVADNVISGNTMRGIYCQDSDTCALIGNTISGNNEHGIVCDYGVNLRALIQGNYVVGNSLYGLVIGRAQAVVLSNVIFGNQRMGVLHHDDYNRPGVYADNLIVGNGIWAASEAAGASFRSEVLFIGNTLVGNYSIYPRAAMKLAGPIKVGNCIMWGNRSPEGKSIDLAYKHPYIADSCIDGGVDSIVNMLNGWEGWGPGNIEADPLFVDPGHWDGDTFIPGDYHLLPGSPCIDAGTNDVDNPDTPEVETLPATDIAGLPRVIDGNLDGTATVDIGAYEYLPGDVNYDGRVNVLDLILVRNSLASDPASSAEARKADVNADGAVNVEDLLLVRARLGK